MTEDYGQKNLTALKEAGYYINDFNDAEKARIIYLIHHPGLRNAKRFINNEITEATACALLKAQVGNKSAIARGQANGGYMKAHTQWLVDYINRNINVKKYFCHELITSKNLEDIGLREIINEF